MYKKLLLLFVFSGILFAGEPDTDEFLKSFLPGAYEVIGRAPDSNQLFSGTIELKVTTENECVLIRKIDSLEIQGNWRIEKSRIEGQTILRTFFIENKIEYETSYLIESDLDNYPRLSGYLYRKDGSTKKPGIETLFYVK